MSNYPPIFKRINIPLKNNISLIQDEFERFWQRLSKLTDNNAERTLAMRKLQEAKDWMCRAESINQFNKEKEKQADDAAKPKILKTTISHKGRREGQTILSKKKPE